MLRLFSQLINDIIGDAIADLLAVEAILRYFAWSLEDWERNTYTDMPSQQLKIPVGCGIFLDLKIKLLGSKIRSRYKKHIG